MQIHLSKNIILKNLKNTRQRLFWIFILQLLCQSSLVFAQNCSCTACPFPIPDVATVNIPLQISGATVNDLSNPSQGVCNVYLKFSHDFVTDLQVKLKSPSGQIVTLIGAIDGNFSNNTIGTSWDIRFIRQSATPQPDPLPLGNPNYPGFYADRWLNSQVWGAGFGVLPPFFGSYYPFAGALENFNSGAVNGTWTVIVQDGVAGQSGVLVSAQIEFCNNSGLNCDICKADGGTFLNVPNRQLCAQDSGLIIKNRPTFGNGIPNTFQYKYQYVVAKSDTIVAYGGRPLDMRNYSAGNYKICGISYAKSDSLLLPPPNFGKSLDTLKKYLNLPFPTRPFCGNLSDSCFNVTIFPRYEQSRKDTICFGDSIVVNNATYRLSGLYDINSKTKNNNCDSIIRLSLTVLQKLQTLKIDTVCFGDTVKVGLKKYFISGNYTDTLKSKISCDSVVNLKLTVLPKVINLIQLTICAEDTVIFKNVKYYQSGFYVLDTLKTLRGCDSINQLLLAVHPPILTDTIFKICDGDSVKVGQKYYTEFGNYVDTLRSSTNCDSVIKFKINVFYGSQTQIDTSICYNSSIQLGNKLYSDSGNYTDILQSKISGCDSIIYLNLTVRGKNQVNLVKVICQGSSFRVGTKIYNATGIYRDTLMDKHACDSIISLYLLVKGPNITAFEITLCEGKKYTVGDSVITTTGTFSDTLTTNSGCDSLVKIYITVNPTARVYDTLEICQGQSVIQGLNTYSTSGIYVDTLQNKFNCDSIVTLYLRVLNQIHRNFSKQICAGDSVSVGKSVYRVTGIYIDTLSSVIVGCDSIVTLNLTVYPKYLFEKPAFICNGTSYLFHSQLLNNAGIYFDTLKSIHNCDSIIKLNLSVLPLKYTQIDTIICKGETIKIGVSAYSTNGTYENRFPSSNGCDSIVTLILTVSNPITTLNARVCRGKLYAIGDTSFLEGGLHKIILKNYLGCDSTIFLNLTIIDSVVVNIDTAICNEEFFLVGSEQFNTSGIYKRNFTSSGGCDSIIYLHLLVYPKNDTIIFKNICQNDTIFIGIHKYFQTGNYTDTLLSVHNCDSVIHLNLKVYPIFSTVRFDTICQNEKITIQNVNYQKDSIYHIQLLSANNCDSSIYLNLKVYPTKLTNLSIDICQKDSILFANKVLKQSGIYTDTLETTRGCDSVITLNLRVHNLYSDSIYRQICMGTSVTIGNAIYSQSGTYTNILQSIYGCDSMVVLQLSVLDTIKKMLNISICEGENITFGGEIFNSAGTYVRNSISSGGCDSIFTLNLKILPKKYTFLSDTICEGMKFQVGNNYYSMSGNFCDTLSSFINCDSVICLKLTVFPNMITNLSKTICENDSFYFAKTYLKIEGNYTDSLKNRANCDSIVFLSLKVAKNCILDVNLIVSQPTCSNNFGAIKLKVFGGVAPYIVEVRNSASQIFVKDTILAAESWDTIAGIVVGQYKLKITDPSGQTHASNRCILLTKLYCHINFLL